MFKARIRKPRKEKHGKGRKEIVERLEAATTLLEKTLSWLEERQGALIRRGGEDLGDRGAEPARTELAEKLAAVERELAE
jgi:hypothetical protein